MVIRCSECGKVRKFGTWIEVHPVIAEQMKKDVEFYYMLCPDCETTPISANHQNNSHKPRSKLLQGEQGSGSQRCTK